MHASPAYTESQLEALAGGEPAVFEQFYRDHHARIYNLAARIVGDPDDAADITQEVFLRAYTHPFQAGGDLRPEPWLYRIAVNASYDHLRRRAARPATSLDAVAEVADTSDRFVDGEIARCVETCLAGLTPRYRTALVLKDLHGLSHAEIAEVMDIHQGAARVLLHRARAAFRRAFRSTAPTGAGGVSMLGLAAFLPELPVPASLQTPPAFASLVPQAAVPATPAPDLVSAGADGGQAGLPGATSAASVPVAAAPAASVPLAVAPVAPAGLLAGLSGAAGVKVAIAVVAVAAATGGGLAARQSALDVTSVDGPASRVRAGVTTSQIAQPAGGPKTYRQQIGEQLRVTGSYRGDSDGGGAATATRSGAGAGGDSADGGATGGGATGAAGDNGAGSSAAGTTAGGGGGNAAAGQGTGADRQGGTGSPSTTGGGATTGGGTNAGSSTNTGGAGTGSGSDPTSGGDTGGTGTGSDPGPGSGSGG